MSAESPALTPPVAVYPDPLPDVLPFGGIHLLAGAPGCGKTALLATLLQRFRDGLPIFGHQPAPLTSIAYFGVDRSWSNTKAWFERAGFPEIPFYSLADDPDFVKGRLRNKFKRIGIFQEVLDRFLAAGHLKPGGLFVCDPLALFLGGNLLDYDTCAVACLEIRDLLRARQVTLLATAHASKQRGEKDRYVRLQDRILGSAALFGFTDTQLYLATPEELETDHHAFLWCPHLAPVETFTLARTPQGLFVPYAPHDAAKAAQQALLELLPIGTPQTYAAIWEQIASGSLAISKATTTRYLRALVSSGALQQPAHGLYLRPKPN